MSWAFEGNCKKTGEYEQMVIDYWVTKEKEEPHTSFYQQGEMADEAVRVCIDTGNLDDAEKWYKTGHHLGLKEPDISADRKALWGYRWHHAQARIASRRKDRADAERYIEAAQADLAVMTELKKQQEVFFPYLTQDTWRSISATTVRRWRPMHTIRRRLLCTLLHGSGWAKARSWFDRGTLAGSMNAAVVGGQAKACPTVSERARRRITRRLIPFLFVLYIVAFLDRVNTGYAGLQMTKDLHFSNEVFGFGSGIFFIGYVLLEIPGSLLVEMWSARKWIARIMISWGFVAALTGLVNTAPQFYWARFLLGVAEAGFFPGVIVYLSHWYRSEDRGKAIAMFMSAIPLSQLLGSPISAALMNIHWFGYAGWRWLLILEGLPSVILGIVTLFYLTDRPQEARWLPDDEKAWITGELEREHRARLAVKQYSMWEAFKNRNVLLLTVAYFFSSNVMYGLSLWLPKMVEKLSGLSTLETTLITAIPFLLAWQAMLLVGWSSDKNRERRWHTAAMLFLAASGLALTRLSGSVGLTIMAFSIAVIGINARFPPFWALPGTFLSGASAAATIGAINCFGNTGGFVGPYVVGWLSNRTGTYTSAVLYLIGSAVVAGTLILFVQKTQAGRGS